jgi:hypothetical protein
MVIVQEAGKLLAQTFVALGMMARDDRVLEQFLLNGFRKLSPNLHYRGAKRLAELTFLMG